MIEKYFTSLCLFFIDEVNEENKDKDDSELKLIADTVYSEANFIFKLTNPIRHLTDVYLTGVPKEKGNDIVVKSLGFKIEVKYPKNGKCKTGTYSSSFNWDRMEKDFEWLFNEIKQGKKGKRAFIIGWFNTGNSFSNLVQLGLPSGPKPDINTDRFEYFPFINKTDSNKTKDIFYQYGDAYKELTVKIKGHAGESANCMFFGKPSDKFHIALYY